MSRSRKGMSREQRWKKKQTTVAAIDSAMKTVPNGMMSRNPGSGDSIKISIPKNLGTNGTSSHTPPPALPRVSFISHIRGYPPDGGDFEFISPPEAPIFRPTEEEFAAGPLDYIARIKAIAEPHGICKIIPPASFKPPFCVDTTQFRFTPRVQRLNELEAQTRIKLNFLEQVVKFWDLQGAALKIPCLDRKALDLYTLHKSVQAEGGFESCTRERKWSKVAARMGYNLTQNKGPIASLLRQHYERVLFPYDVFLSGATIAPEESNGSTPKDVANECSSTSSVENDPSPSNGLGQEKSVVEKSTETSDGRSLRPSPRRVSRRMQSQQQSQARMAVVQPISLNTKNKELKKLQVFGAGPKMPGYLCPVSSLETPTAETPSCSETTNTTTTTTTTNGDGLNGNGKQETEQSGSRADQGSISSNQNKGCVQCGEDQASFTPIIACTNCASCYHLHCLIPPLNDLPKGLWHCPRCIALKVQTLPQPFTHEFGFAQSQRDYSLEEFKEAADNFKQDYFRMQPHLVPLHVVEREFWRVVASLEDTVAVEYGADLHTNDYGSGFPSKMMTHRVPEDTKYLHHPWNLNNLPILDGSVFKYMNSDISGVIVPWMYVGMCFSTFCWHNEDHWSYSINYLHSGEAKSWYGVPGEHADTFERAMKRIAPELFESQPDLLHQLVTICNPNILMADGVPIYRCHQQAGEFVVTFPRAYHAGYNQGINLAEAVNFAPADWLPIGRVCVAHYSMLHRFCVFSHDELICKMASDPENLDVSIAAATYHDMIAMVQSEKKARLEALEWGITNADRESYELLPDDERQCDYCKTTCFLSAVVCPCNPCKLVCIAHRNHLCKTCHPSDHTLKYRYTLDELPLMLQRLNTRAQGFDMWADTVKKCLQPLPESDRSKPLLSDLKKLIEEAKTRKYPKSSRLFLELQDYVSMAETKVKAVQGLLNQQRHHEEHIKSLRDKSMKMVTCETERTVKLKRKADSLENDPKVIGSANTRTTRSGRLASLSPKKFEAVNSRLSLEELNILVDDILDLTCNVDQADEAKHLLDKCISIHESVDKILNAPQSGEDSKEILSVSFMEGLIQDAESIGVVNFGKSLDEVKIKLDEVSWTDSFNAAIYPEKLKSDIDIDLLKSVAEEGSKLIQSCPGIESKLVQVEQLIAETEKWIAHEQELKEKIEKELEAKKKEERLAVKKQKMMERKEQQLLKQMNGDGQSNTTTSPSKSKSKSRKSKKADICSMGEKCLKPNVDEVNWVQCDGPCEGWLHQLCAGIRNPDDIVNLEKWFCPSCSSNVEASVVGAAEALLSMAGLVEPSSVSVLDQVASNLNSSNIAPSLEGIDNTMK